MSVLVLSELLPLALPSPLLGEGQGWTRGKPTCNGPRLLYRSVTAGGGARDGCERKGGWANEKKEKMGNELSIRDAMMTTTLGLEIEPKEDVCAK